MMKCDAHGAASLPTPLELRNGKPFRSREGLYLNSISVPASAQMISPPSYTTQLVCPQSE